MPENLNIHSCNRAGSLTPTTGKPQDMAGLQVRGGGGGGVVQPFILRHWLRLAARAFTLFLKTLVSELPACFLHLRITDLAEWVSALPSWKCQVIGEADCTQQFDKVPPTSIVDSLKEAGTWLRKKKQWRAHETVWSIHKDNPAHDRAGMGQHTRFEYITQQQLEALVEFSLTKDIYAQAAGQLWCRSASSTGTDRGSTVIA